MKLHSALPLFVAGLFGLTTACTDRDPAVWCFIEGHCGLKGKICPDHPCKNNPAIPCRDFSQCFGTPLTIQECFTGAADSVVVCNDDTETMECDGEETTVYRQPPSCDFACEPSVERRLQTLDKCFGNGPGKAGGGGSCICSEGGLPGPTFCATVTRAMGNMVWVWRDQITVDDLGRDTGVPPPNPINDDKKIIMDCDTGILGDPHIKKWDGTWYEWHGECDAVMLHAPDFGYGEGLDIHVRTKVRYDYSYIETVAIAIGEEVMEVSGFGEYFINGVNGADLPAVFANRVVTHTVLAEQIDHKFLIELGHGVLLHIDTHKDIVSVDIESGTEDGEAFQAWFINSTGLMGSSTGENLARDGVTVITDPNAMGQEWQVRENEPKLFQNLDREPQYPQSCRIPSPDAIQTGRRLGQTISQREAEEACSMWKTQSAKERCLYDVMKTNDLGMAAVGAY